MLRWNAITKFLEFELLEFPKTTCKILLLYNCVPTSTSNPESLQTSYIYCKYSSCSHLFILHKECTYMSQCT